MDRFTKLNAAAEALPDDATEGHVMTRDNETGLVWDVAEFDGKRMEHADAIKACADLRTAGFDGWRLPTIKELLTLVDYERVDPAIDTNFFPNARAAGYWSSTPCAGFSGSAWCVYFGSGGYVWGLVSYGFRVRACRPSQAV